MDGEAVRMKILLLGRDGQVGRELQSTLAPLGTLVACGRHDADFADAAALRALVARHRPDVVVNAAAYTAVDRAESEAALAMRINGDAPAVLAAEMKRLGGWLVHYSTDYVFDGQKSAAYTEADTPAPQNQYGHSKLAGERAIAASGCQHLIFRTSWVYGRHGGNFIHTMLRLACERDTLHVVNDQRGAPTGAALIARITARAIKCVVGPATRGVAPGFDDDQTSGAPAGGLYHLAAGGDVTWHAYAAFLVEYAAGLGMPLRVTSGGVMPVASNEYSAAARRPASSLLDTTKLCAAFGVTMPDWREGVQDVLKQLHSATFAGREPQ